MSLNLTTQRELLKTALVETDNYLSILVHAKNQGIMPTSMANEFVDHYRKAWVALELLGIVAEHEEYMKNHLLSVWAMLKKGEELSESTNNEEDINDEEIQKMVDDLTWEDIVDLYDEIELMYETDEEETEEDAISEGLSAQSRLKRRQMFSRLRSKRNVARGIKLRRASTIGVLKKRAYLAARRALYSRFLRGRDKSSMSASEKDRIEQQVGRMKYMQQAIAIRMLPKMRAIEQKRLAHYRSKH